MSNIKKVLICIAVFIACFVIGIIAVLIINRVQEPDEVEVIDKPTLEEDREAFMELSRDERAAILMEEIWGEDFSGIIQRWDTPTSPWPNITVDRFIVRSLNELEVVTYVILENEPYLSVEEERVMMPLNDDLYVDLKEELHTYSDFSFRYPESEGENVIKVTCRRDGVLMDYEYSFDD